MLTIGILPVHPLPFGIPFTTADTSRSSVKSELRLDAGQGPSSHNMIANHRESNLLLSQGESDLKSTCALTAFFHPRILLPSFHSPGVPRVWMIYSR